ncbi:MAG: RNA-binding S4 domain-containing protein [Clostridia bacterium]|nr:RNA-binding S4 domain-containing protein [Clostridia bacterium]
MEKYTEEVKITTEFIKLDQLLKFTNIAESGAMAKEMIADEIVSVNGEICTMRGKKVRPGDSVLVEFEDEIFEITVN